MAKISDNKRHDFRFYSESEHDAAYVISRGIVANNFRIIDFRDGDKYNQYIIDYQNGKFKISFVEQNSYHNLASVLPLEIRTRERIAQWNLFFFLKNQVYQYDSYYDSLIEPSDIIDKINASIVDFPIAKDEILFVKGEYTNCKPLLYCLQKRFQKVIIMPNYDIKPINFISSFIVPLAMNAKIGITPQTSPIDFIEDWSPAIFVPLVERVLETRFYGDLLWRDIMPDNPKRDFDLGEFPIKAVWIRFDYDGQDQIYVTVRDADGIENRLITHKRNITPQSDSEIQPFTKFSGVVPESAMPPKHENNWVNIAEVKSYYKKEDLEAMPSPLLNSIREEILSAYKQFNYIYTDTNVWVENKVVDKQGKRYISTPNLISIEQLTNMMPELETIHYLHQYVYDEIEIMQRGVHKDRFERNAEKRREEFIANERQKILDSDQPFGSDEYERLFNKWKVQYHYEERLQREDDLKVAANRAIETYKKLKRIQEDRRSQTGRIYFIREGADFDNKVRDLEDASNAADREISRSIIDFYKQGKKVLLITNDEGMWSTLRDVREKNCLIPGTGIPNPDMPSQDNIARLKSYNLRGHMMALSNINKILSSR